MSVKTIFFLILASTSFNTIDCFSFFQFDLAVPYMTGSFIFKAENNFQFQEMIF